MALLALANLMVTHVGQRTAWQLHARRGIATDKVWASRGLLLTGFEHLTPKQRARFHAAFAAEDPTNEIGAAHAVKERLRMLLGECAPHQIRHRLFDFYDAAARASMEETTRLASTIVTWWPAVLVALTDKVANARTERFNRIINRPSMSDMGSPTWTTTEGASWSTSPSPEAQTSSMKSGTAPLKCGDPFSWVGAPDRQVCPALDIGVVLRSRSGRGGQALATRWVDQLI